VKLAAQFNGINYSTILGLSPTEFDTHENDFGVFYSLLNLRAEKKISAPSGFHDFIKARLIDGKLIQPRVSALCVDKKLQAASILFSIGFITSFSEAPRLQGGASKRKL